LAPPSPTPFPYTTLFRSHLAFPTEGGLTAYANYYPPANPDHAPPAGERPPLVVKCHGGPTSAPARPPARSSTRPVARAGGRAGRSEEHTSELQSPDHLVC